MRRLLNILAVCVVNAIKLLCMLYSISILADDGRMTKPLATIGDAITSFLCIKDDATKNLALIEKRLVVKEKTSWSLQRTSSWAPDRSRWYKLVTKKRLFLTFGLYVFYREQVEIDD